MDWIDDRFWELLMNAIDNERVVPIIGSSLYLASDSSGNKYPLDEYLLGDLANRFNLNNHDADINAIIDAMEIENIRNRGYFTKQTDIYFAISQSLGSFNVNCATELTDFLAISKFPLILTTSYAPGLEERLISSYENIDILSYDKSSRVDIHNNLSSQKPTLYYLFGKYSRYPKSYMATEDDLLDYLHLWHNRDTRPQQLCEYLNGKFLLLLGCNYPNWLFRFFWHSIKNFSLREQGCNEIQGIVTFENEVEDKELQRFLSRMQTFTCKDSIAFISEFMSRWEERKRNLNDRDEMNVDCSDSDIDIFISYAHEDVESVSAIATRLREFGATVWFDEKLEWSDLYESIIKTKIQTAKRFVPILSKTTMRLERRFYRKEWELAMKEKSFRYGMPYFAPIVIDDSDVNSELIPEEFRDAHIISANQNGFETEMKKLIRSFRQ